jgi:hypothetical protein
MAQKLDLAFQLTANASGMAAGVAQADRELSKVGASAKATSAEFRQAAKITSELRTPTEKYADTIGKLDAMLQKGLLSQEVYGRAVAKADAELKAATSSMDSMARSASITERIVNGLSGAIGGVGDATKSVADAGVSVIKFGKDIAWTYAEWKLFSALRNPASLKDFALGALKGAMAARTMILAAKGLGIGLALGGGAAGTAAAAVLGLSNPLIGGALLAFNLGKAFLSAKDRALEMAAGITAGTVSLEALNAELGQVQAQQVDNLAFAMEEVTASGQRSEAAFAGLADVFVTPFIGAFAAIQSGLAGFTDGISSVIEGVTSIISPIAQVLAPIVTLLGTVVEGVLKTIGVLANLTGVVLKVAGAVTRTFLSPFIVGLTNVVEAIRSGMNAAFEFIGSRIDWVSKKVQDFYAYMATVPVIGGAFASGEKPAAAGVAGAAAAAAAVDDGAEKARQEAAAAMAKQDSEDAQRQQKAMTRQTDQFFEATKAAEQFGEAGRAAAKEYESGLMDLNAQLEDGRINEETYNREAEKRKQIYNDQINGIEQRNAAEKKAAEDAARAQEKAAEDAKRAADEAAKEQERKVKEAAAVSEKMAAKQGDLDAITAERQAALGGKSNEALKANDIRSSEGMSAFIALATGREDPAIAEYRKQTQKLDEIRAELRALQTEKVTILNGAAA